MKTRKNKKALAPLNKCYVLCTFSRPGITGMAKVKQIYEFIEARQNVTGLETEGMYSDTLVCKFWIKGNPNHKILEKLWEKFPEFDSKISTFNGDGYRYDYAKMVGEKVQSIRYPDWVDLDVDIE